MGVSQISGAFLGVPRIRIIVFWCLLRSPCFWKLLCSAAKKVLENLMVKGSGCRVWGLGLGDIKLACQVFAWKNHRTVSNRPLFALHVSLGAWNS